jgi:hypothetical protein
MMRLGLLSATLLLTFAPDRLPGAAAPPPNQWITVVAPAYREAMKPLIAHRQAQGLKVVVLAPEKAPDLRKRLASLCKAHPGRSSILLVGDVRSIHANREVPACDGTISRMLDQPTDASYGCLDGSRLPQVAVGRFPAREVAHCEAMVRKTIALEKAGPGAWKQQLRVLAGIPAFNPAVDRLVESLAFARFDRLAPTWGGRALYTSASSRFFLPEKELSTAARDMLAEQHLVTLYLGHSDPRGLYAGGETPWLTGDDFAKLRMPSGGLFFTFGCLGAQLRGFGGEGYTLAAMRNPNGPAATIGSMGVCFAAMVQLATDRLFERAFAERLPTTVGECWLACLEGVAHGKIDFLTYRLLDSVDGDPKIPQVTQRQEHLEMFILLGDPALRLPRIADDIIWRAPVEIEPGTEWTIEGTLPERLRGARVTVELERTPASVPEGLLPVTPERRAEILRANFTRANRFLLAETTTTAEGQRFTACLQLPEKLPWPRVIVRIRASTKEAEAATAARVSVKPAREAKK